VVHQKCALCRQFWKQHHQALLKAKYCPRVAPVASTGSNKVAPSSEWHLVNPGQLVQAVSWREETHKKPTWPWTWYSAGFYRLSRVHVHCPCKISTSSSWVIVLLKKIGDVAENNTGTKSAKLHISETVQLLNAQDVKYTWSTYWCATRYLQHTEYLHNPHCIDLRKSFWLAYFITFRIIPKKQQSDCIQTSRARMTMPQVRSKRTIYIIKVKNNTIFLFKGPGPVLLTCLLGRCKLSWFITIPTTFAISEFRFRVGTICGANLNSDRKCGADPQ